MAFTLHTDPIPLVVDAGGPIRVAKTRVTLDTIVEHVRGGATVADLKERFPVLDTADIHAVLAYYLRHREEVDQYLAEQAREAEAVLAALGDRHEPWAAVSAQLKARQDTGADAGRSLLS